MKPICPIQRSPPRRKHATTCNNNNNSNYIIMLNSSSIQSPSRSFRRYSRRKLLFVYFSIVYLPPAQMKGFLLLYVPDIVSAPRLKAHWRQTNKPFSMQGETSQFPLLTNLLIGSSSQPDLQLRIYMPCTVVACLSVNTSTV